MRLNRYLFEDEQKIIAFFDIDSTLVNSTTRTWIIKDGKKIRSLEGYEAHTYKLKEGESFDDSELISAKNFYETARPISTVVRELNKQVNEGVDVYLLTARPTLDDMDLYKRTLTKCGIPMNRVKLVIAGDEMFVKKLSNAQIPDIKKRYAKHYISLDDYQIARIYDDYIGVCREFLSLQYTFKGTQFEAYHVKKSGEMMRI